MGRVRKGEGVSMVKGVEGFLPKSLPGVKKLLHNINNHRYCVPKAQIIWLSNLLMYKCVGHSEVISLKHKKNRNKIRY
jgi:hypothetical protein